ncbi:glucosaminidase domain-containing protein [Litchfieldia alkalitelluris]|uniref:glucosaminidase domain-containing protein n=1 Tax=Litchfieldia alkalitelluris TaxID=304268 RepID=UPI000998CB3A|nr:glucosaminidase domain-containing protein [Litchfieldia alkalitelluris]
MNIRNPISIFFILISAIAIFLLFKQSSSLIINTNTQQNDHHIKEIIETEQREIEQLITLQEQIASEDSLISKKSSSISLSADELNEVLKGELQGLGHEFIKAGKEYGIDPVFLVALAAQETGWGESTLMASPWNNVGGITCMPHNYEEIFGEQYQNPGCGETIDGGTKWQKFNSIEDSIHFKAAYLKSSYLENGTKTISGIQEKYAPSNALNDQSGLNHYWTENIVAIMKDIRNDLG